jgi:hypothetical protein
VSAIGADGAAAAVRAALSLVAPGTMAALSVAVTVGRLEGNRRGVITMTSAISASANSVRLSMQVFELP